MKAESSSPIRKRNLWPYGIVLTFILFISGTAALIVIACQNNADLVSTQYYEDEILFQTEIDRVKRAQTLASPARVTYTAAQKRITITLPGAHATNELQGSIQLYRPSAAGLDQTIELKPDATGVQAFDTAQLQPGLWKVKVLWTVNGAEYQIDERVVIEANQS